MEFAKVVKQDYLQAKKAGYLDAKRLDEVGKYNSRLMAIKHPKMYVLFRPLHDLRNTIKPMISKTIKTVSPRYKQRLKTIETVGQLNDIQSELAVKLSEVESKIEEKNAKS